MKCNYTTTSPAKSPLCNSVPGSRSGAFQTRKTASPRRTKVRCHRNFFKIEVARRDSRPEACPSGTCRASHKISLRVTSSLRRRNSVIGVSHTSASRRASCSCFASSGISHHVHPLENSVFASAKSCSRSACRRGRLMVPHGTGQKRRPPVISRR